MGSAPKVPASQAGIQVNPQNLWESQECWCTPQSQHCRAEAGRSLELTRQPLYSLQNPKPLILRDPVSKINADSFRGKTLKTDLWLTVIPCKISGF